MIKNDVAYLFSRCFFLLCLISLLIDVEAFRLKRATGGVPVNENEYKYVVAIKINGGIPCSGGILNDRYVLTAAHCVIDVNTNKTFAGSIQIAAATKNWKSPGPNAFTVDVKKVFVPIVNGELWNSGKISADIAILELRESLKLGENENLEALSLPEFNSSYLYDNTTTYQISGYGWDRIAFDRNGKRYDDLHSHGVVTGQLKWANVQFVSTTNCTDNYESLIDDTHVCGGFANFHFTDICRGDGGSPLVLDRTNEVVAVVTAASYECNSFAYPSVYTRVDSYLEFISNVLNGQEAADIYVEDVIIPNDDGNSGKLTCWLPNKGLKDKVIYSDMCTLQEVTGKTYNDDVFLVYDIDTYQRPWNYKP